LTRSGALGGGAPSVTKLARYYYGKSYRRLIDKRKEVIKAAQRRQWKWYNYHELERICASTCTGISEDGSACDNCVALLRLRRFRRAIKRPIPDAYNFRYLPKQYLNESIAQIYARSTGLEEL
ncbi:hypothetical protein FB446DRAFT_615012, partial [Lentinula raphanica]